MPSFFDKNSLRPEQLARWDAAVAEYVRVRAANRVAAGLLLDERLPIDGHPGSAKSALFARLLNGKAALPYPPPTSYSYPWYAVVEEAGPFPVSVGRAMSGGGARETTGGFVLRINQCTWEVESLNEAAERLLTLDRERAVSHEGWPSELLQQIREIYSQAPELMVRYGQWPAYRLRLGRGESLCLRKRAERVVQGSHRATGSVLNIDQLRLGASIETANDQAACVLLAYKTWVLEKVAR